MHTVGDRNCQPTCSLVTDIPDVRTAASLAGLSLTLMPIIPKKVDGRIAAGVGLWYRIARVIQKIGVHVQPASKLSLCPIMYPRVLSKYKQSKC